jgi:hypothetical protein
MEIVSVSRFAWFLFFLCVLLSRISVTLYAAFANSVTNFIPCCYSIILASVEKDQAADDIEARHARPVRGGEEMCFRKSTHGKSVDPKRDLVIAQRHIIA